jgi:hypothetical protein
MSSTLATPVAADPDIHVVFRGARAQVLRARQWSMQPDTLLIIRRPAVSSWSVATHLDHVVTVVNRVVPLLRELARAAHNGVPVDVPPAVQEVFRSGIIPRGRIQAPEAVQPRGLGIDTLRRELASALDEVNALEPLLPEIAASHATAPHPVMGPLPPRLWLRLLDIHTRHHLNICCEIAGANL